MGLTAGKMNRGYLWKAALSVGGLMLRLQDRKDTPRDGHGRNRSAARMCTSCSVQLKQSIDSLISQSIDSLINNPLIRWYLKQSIDSLISAEMPLRDCKGRWLLSFIIPSRKTEKPISNVSIILSSAGAIQLFADISTMPLPFRGRIRSDTLKGRTGLKNLLRKGLTSKFWMSDSFALLGVIWDNPQLAILDFCSHRSEWGRTAAQSNLRA